MSVQRRPKSGRPPSGQPIKWIVRYRDPAGKEHSRSFATQGDAKRFDAEQVTKMSTGEWIDPGQQTVDEGQPAAAG